VFPHYCGHFFAFNADNAFRITSFHAESSESERQSAPRHVRFQPRRTLSDAVSAQKAASSQLFTYIIYYYITNYYPLQVFSALFFAYFLCKESKQRNFNKRTKYSIIKI
jgi:hypothetical protein